MLLAWGAYQHPHTATFAMDTPPVVLPLRDMHAVEQLPDDTRLYRWTDEQSTVWLPNPGGTILVQAVLAGGGERTVPVTISANDAVVPFLVAPGFRRYALLLPPARGERFAVAIDAPGIEVERRTLGIMVSDVQISGRGSVPGQVVAALLVATAGSYALLRKARRRPASAAAVVVVLQGVALWWQIGGGWRFALFGPALLLMGGTALVAVFLEQWAHGERHRAPETHRRVVLDRNTVLLLLLATGCMLLVRLPWLVAPDPVGDLELAARRMGLLFTHGLSGAYRYDGDYMPLRLYLLYGLSQLVVMLGGSFHDPLPPVTLLLIKLPGMLADVITLAIIYTWSLRWWSPRRAATIALLYALVPPVWINVAWWGQVDALLMLPLLTSIVLLDHAEGRWSWLCWSTALLIKPQAIVLAPLLFFATLCRHGSRGIAQGGLLAVGVFATVCTPLALAQQGPGLMQAYLGSVGRFPRLTSGAYNLWYLLTLGKSGDDVGQGIGPVSFRLIGLLLVGGVALLVAAALLLRCNERTIIQGAAVLALAFFALPTQIHERYLFLPLAFLALCIALDTRMVIPFLVLAMSATLNILGTLDGFLPRAYAAINSHDGIMPLALALVNLLVLAALLVNLLMYAWRPTIRTPR